MTRKYLGALVLAFVVLPALAAPDKAHLLAVGQGISSPSSITTVNFSSGFTSESPIGAIYQDSLRLTAEYDKNGTSGFGGEVGYGAGSWGIAGGYYTRDCKGCEGRAAGALGLAIQDIGFGIRFAEDLYSIALMLNPQGRHRIGFMGDLNESGGSNNRVTAFGVGYSYVASQFTFTVDASKLEHEDSRVEDDPVILTPGLSLRSDILQVSVNDRITFNTRNSVSQEKETRHDFWFGIGISQNTWHIAVYMDYVSEIALAGTLFF